MATGLHKIGLAVKQQSWLQANEEGLSPTQGQILAALVDGRSSATELAARLGLSLPTISDSVRVLVDKAHVVKTPDPRHPRASLIELTTAGRQLAIKAQAWPEFLSVAIDALSEAEQAALLAALIKMIRTLQDHGQIPISRMCVSCVHFRPRVHDGAKPHHCAFVDAPMADQNLRLDCAEHEVAPAPQQAAAWQRFTIVR